MPTRQCLGMLMMLTACNGALRAVVKQQQQPGDMWHALGAAQPAQAFKTIFGESGARGEYMDAYAKQAMEDRCMEDYKWATAFKMDAFAAERADMVPSRAFPATAPAVGFSLLTAGRRRARQRPSCY